MNLLTDQRDESLHVSCTNEDVYRRRRHLMHIFAATVIVVVACPLIGNVVVTEAGERKPRLQIHAGAPFTNKNVVVELGNRRNTQRLLWAVTISTGQQQL